MAWTPHADYDSRGIHGTESIRICATTQPSKLPSNYGNRPRASARNRKVLTKPITIQKIHRYIRSPKNQTITVVQPVFLSPLVEQLILFGKVYTLSMLQYLITYYRAIDEIDFEENAVKMMGPYDPAEPLARLIEKLGTGREFTCAGGKMIPDAMVVSKGIALFAYKATFNEDIIEWRRQTTNLNT